MYAFHDGSAGWNGVRYRLTVSLDGLSMAVFAGLAWRYVYCGKVLQMICLID